jgi:hypothetical protein
MPLISDIKVQAEDVIMILKDDATFGEDVTRINLKPENLK